MSLGSIKLAGATALAGITALALAGVGAELRARAAISRLIAGTPGLAVAGTSFDLLDNTIALRGLSFESPGLRVSIGAVVMKPQGGIAAAILSPLVTPAMAFPTGDASGGDAGPASEQGAAQGSGAGQAPGVAIAENVAIVYQGVTYTIPKIEVAGTTLTNADVAAMLDSASSESVESRLRRFSAASVTMPEIKADTAAGDFEQHWNQQQVLFASVVNGKAAVGSAGPGILKTKSAQGTSVAETGGLQMTGVDMGQIVHVATAARADDAEAQQVLAQSLAISAIKLHGTDNTLVTLASLKEAGLRARPLALNSQGRSLLLSTGKPGDPAYDAFVVDIEGSVGFDLLQADDLVVTPPKADKGPIRLARITATGVHDRRIGGVTLQDLRYDQASNHVSLAGAELKDVALPANLDGKSPPSVASLTLSNAAVDVDTAEAGQPESRLAFSLERVGFTATAAAAGALPARTTAQVDKLRIAIRPDMSPMLIAMGYPKLDITSRLVTTYDAATKTFGVEDLTLDGVDMGKAALKLQLGNVTDAILSSDAEAKKAATAAILFKGLDLVVNDAGLVDRVLGYQATKDGVSVGQERDKAIDLVRNKLPVLAGDPAKLKPVEDAVARFLADPKLPLHLAVTSPAGLGSADAELLGDPNALLDRMTIVATAGQ